MRALRLDEIRVVSLLIDCRVRGILQNGVVVLPFINLAEVSGGNRLSR